MGTVQPVGSEIPRKTFIRFTGNYDNVAISGKMRKNLSYVVNLSFLNCIEIH